MKLDNENQRAFFLQMFNRMEFPGAVLDEAFRNKMAVMQAEVDAPAPKDDLGHVEPGTGSE